MPTPYGSRGAVIVSADELRVLRGALAAALHPHPASAAEAPSAAEVREFVQLAEALEETAEEGRRLHAFRLADLARYRTALPGSAVGYLEQLSDALDEGHLPTPEDLAALRTLPALAATWPEADRRKALLRRCERLAEHAVRDRLRVVPGGGPPPQGAAQTRPAAVPA